MHAKNNFDFLRFLLATSVILSHSWPLLYGDYEAEPMSVLTRGQAHLGSMAVWGFFLLSGFLITGSWTRSKTTGQYVSNRVRRIIPGYVAAALICWFVVGPLGGAHSFDRAVAFKMLRDTLTISPPINYTAFVNNPFPHHLNTSLWTIRYEILCYIGIPFAILLCQKLPRWSILVVTLAMVVLGDLELKVPGLSHAHLYAFFLMGACFWTYRESIRWSFALTAVCIAVVIGASLAGHLFLGTVLAGSYVLFSIAFAPSPLNHFGKYGDFSYGIYLYSFPIQQLLVMSIPGTSPIVHFLLATPLSIVAGFTSWHLVEKRFMRKK